VESATQSRGRIAEEDHPGEVVVCIADSALRVKVAAILRGEEQLRVTSTHAELVARLGPRLRCVILGARRPDRELAAEVELIHRDLRVPMILIVGRAGAADVRRALDAGFDGVVDAGRLAETLRPTLAAVAAGQSCVPGRTRAELALGVLTTREKQILALVAAELTNAQIAARLYLAESTVKSHLSSAFRKLNVSSRHEAADLIRDSENSRVLGIPTYSEVRTAAIV
jgi:DNA-binding NarL/FixJ family response regulator